MKIKTKVRNIEEFETFTAMLDHNGIFWSNGDMIYHSFNYDNARAFMLQGGTGDFEVDYELIDDVIVRFYQDGDTSDCPSGELTISFIVTEVEDKLLQMDLIKIRELMLKERLNPDYLVFSLGRDNDTYKFESSDGNDYFTLRKNMGNFIPYCETATIDGVVLSVANSMMDAILRNRKRK